MTYLDVCEMIASLLSIFMLVTQQPFGVMSCSQCMIHKVSGAFPIFVASTECKICLLYHLPIERMRDSRATDHVMKFHRPSPSVFAYYKRSKTGGVEGLETRLALYPTTCFERYHTLEDYHQ